MKSIKIESGAPDSAANPATLERVKLTHPIQHQGKQYQAGDELDVRPQKATWLRERGVVAQLKKDPA